MALQHHCNFTKYYCPGHNAWHPNFTKHSACQNITTKPNIALATISDTPTSPNIPPAKTSLQNQILPLPQYVTLQLHRILRLPEKVTLWLKYLNFSVTAIIPWLNSSLTEPFLGWTFPWLNYSLTDRSLTELFLDWTVDLFHEWTFSLALKLRNLESCSKLPLMIVLLCTCQIMSSHWARSKQTDTCFNFTMESLLSTPGPGWYTYSENSQPLDGNILCYEML